MIFIFYSISFQLTNKMSLTDIIAEAIKVPNMDVKNITNIIEEYNKYDIRDFDNYESVIEIEIACQKIVLIKDTLEIFQSCHNCLFKNNKMVWHNDTELNETELFNKIFVKDIYNKDHYNKYWKRNIFLNEDAFTKFYLRRLMEATIYLQYSKYYDEDEEDDYVQIKYNGICLFSERASNCQDAGEYPNLKDKFCDIYHLV